MEISPYEGSEVRGGGLALRLSAYQGHKSLTAKLNDIRRDAQRVVVHRQGKRQALIDGWPRHGPYSNLFSTMGDSDLP